MKPISIRVYGAHCSQPTRAVLDLCKMADISYEFKVLDYTKGDHKKTEYLSKYPLGEMPCIEDLRPDHSGFILGESNAIMKYICTTF